MQIYLVGGAIRDTRLGLPVKERDWVVVGSRAADMLSQGYRQVGRDFPVFLHPETSEEYALARTERKTGKGYGGFTVHAAPEVTLEEDLKRRDLTINAIAQDQQTGNIIDPFGGCDDLNNRILRHVSASFVEDPLRIIRIARFAAKLSPFGFTIADETRHLLNIMVKEGELDHLTPERVWQELHKVCQTPKPSVFIQTLKDCGALAVLFPEIDVLFGIPNPPQYHPEIDTGKHLMLVLDEAAKRFPDPKVIFASLLHDVGKALTPEDQWPHHPGHETGGVPIVKQFCDKFRVPKAYKELSVLVCCYHPDCHLALEKSANELLTLFHQLDIFRRYDRFELFLQACEADARGCEGLAERDYPQPDHLRKLAHCVRQVEIDDLLKHGLTGQALANAIEQKRLAAIEATL